MNDGHTNPMTSGGGQNVNLGTLGSITPVAPMQLTPNNGSIILNNGTPKKKVNKWIIVAIVAVMLSLGLAIASAIITSVPRNNDSVANRDLPAEKVAFNEYMNYIIYGEDSQDDLDADVFQQSSFYIYSQLENVSANIGYFDELENKYNNFREIYEGDQPFEDINELFYIVPTMNALSTDEILNLYLSYGENYTSVTIDDTYDFNTDTYSSYMADYLATERQLGLEVLNYYVVANQNGCIIDSTINNACTSAMSEAEDIATTLLDSGFEVISSQQVMSSHVMEVIDAIYDEIYNTETEEGL